MKTKKNAGFSLVELIVVIAIMAVLVGVLAPAYLKYVEKSRKSSDISAFSDIINASTNVASDTQYEQYIQMNSTFEIVVEGGTVTLQFCGVKAEGTNDAGYKLVAGEWASVSKGDNYNLKSKEFKAAEGTAKGTVQSDNSVEWTSAPGKTGDVFKDMRAYSPDFDSKFEKAETTSTPTA